MPTGGEVKSGVVWRPREWRRDAGGLPFELLEIRKPIGLRLWIACKTRDGRPKATGIRAAYFNT